ncbi:uncharacterized protein LOC125494884 [Beta vulgaris subsp. vulgaris]|uniref:uncharacterized protein LOC125494884 n=1 Tax=Beta vulgaris subsp. vulgaris TaxID=3555 RepID=UPI002036CE60|nr:uncharacterized protein LOC125494884 [Beta vulgaris subsp. vulgaris]
MDFEKEELRSIPIWVPIRIGLKYWGEKSLFKILAQIGQPVQCDDATLKRDKVKYARVLVRVKLDQTVPNSVAFLDENGGKQECHVQYEWKPKQSVVKSVAPENQKSSQFLVDAEGFQMALRPIKLKTTNIATTSTDNAFDILLNVVEGEEGALPSTMDRILIWNVRGLNNPKKQLDVRTCGALGDKGKGLQSREPLSECFWRLGSSQAIHCQVSPKKRIVLKHHNTNDSWIIGGDMNCVMNVEERIGAPMRRHELEDINQCMHECNMVDVKATGNLFTWNNKQQGEARVISKIDRVMANPAWQAQYCNAEVGFMNEGSFDHSPALLTVYPRAN